MEGQFLVARVEQALTALGLEFEREAPIGNFVADFLVPSLRLIVEVDGDAHKIVRQRYRDGIKNTFYKREGYTYLRLTPPNIERRDMMFSLLKTKISQITGEEYKHNGVANVRQL